LFAIMIESSVDSGWPKHTFAQSHTSFGRRSLWMEWNWIQSAKV